MNKLVIAVATTFHDTEGCDVSQYLVDYDDTTTTQDVVAALICCGDIVANYPPRGFADGNICAVDFNGNQASPVTILARAVLECLAIVTYHMLQSNELPFGDKWDHIEFDAFDGSTSTFTVSGRKDDKVVDIFTLTSTELYESTIDDLIKLIAMKFDCVYSDKFVYHSATIKARYGDLMDQLIVDQLS